MTMDQDLLNQLLALGRLNLPVEVVREVLEHEKWKLLEQHKHEKEMALLGIGAKTPSPNLDPEFNDETSGGLAEPGTISKMKVCQAALKRAGEIENPDNFPESLLSLLISISWCGQRMGHWPMAKDAKQALSLRSDFDKAIERYGVRRVYKAVELISNTLDTWDTRIISEQIEKLNQDYSEVKSVSISSSPLFAEFLKTHPDIDPELFDKCYSQNNEEFVKTALHILRKEFPKNPPPELEHIQGWEQRYLQHLPNYLNKWQKDLRSMENRMKIAQRAWKESIS